MRLSEPQSRFGRGGEEEKSHDFSYREMNPGRPVRSLVTILTELFQSNRFDIGLEWLILIALHKGLIEDLLCKDVPQYWTS